MDSILNGFNGQTLCAKGAQVAFGEEVHTQARLLIKNNNFVRIG